MEASQVGRMGRYSFVAQNSFAGLLPRDSVGLRRGHRCPGKNGDMVLLIGVLGVVGGVLAWSQLARYPPCATWASSLMWGGVAFVLGSRLGPIPAGLLATAAIVERRWGFGAAVLGRGKRRATKPREGRVDSPRRSGSLTRQEALSILGLPPNASPADINKAHRQLMKRLHPDRGGSTHRASQINLARDALLDS